jgi:hypothetical protein
MISDVESRVVRGSPSTVSDEALGADGVCISGHCSNVAAHESHKWPQHRSESRSLVVVVVVALGDDGKRDSSDCDDERRRRRCLVVVVVVVVRSVGMCEVWLQIKQNGLNGRSNGQLLVRHTTGNTNASSTLMRATSDPSARTCVRINPRSMSGSRSSSRCSSSIGGVSYEPGGDTVSCSVGTSGCRIASIPRTARQTHRPKPVGIQHPHP